MGSDDLQFHAFCLTDTGTRLDQYARALAHTIHAGDVVIDIGAGTGILSFMACAAGASRVYAVEASDAIAYGEVLASRSRYTNLVTFIHAASSQATLPERADVIVADIHDTFGLQTHGLGALLDARDRLLKPGGSIVPSHVDLLAAPVEAHDLYRRSVDIWHQQVHGVDLTPLRGLAVNQRYPARFAPPQLLAPPAPVGSLALATARGVHAGGSAAFVAARSGTMHGVCGCFVTTLADNITIGNVPGDSHTTNFAQAFFPIETPQPIDRGDRIAIAIDTIDGAQTRWQVDITPAGGSETRRFDHSTFYSTPIRPDRLEKQSADYRPRLTPRGAIERVLLDTFDGTRSAGEIERWLVQRFGSQLASPREAAAFLKATIERCG